MNLGNVGHDGSRLLQGQLQPERPHRENGLWFARRCHSSSINLPLGFELIHCQHQKDFREREALGRDARDSKHG
jgi:hypothetical protein